MKKKQPPRGSVAGANAEKITALEKRNRILEGYVDTYKAEIDHHLSELEALKLVLAAKDERIRALGGLL